jgi:Amt family ammonium transporter
LLLLIKLKIDDAVDAIPVHLFNGAWAFLLSDICADPANTLNAYSKEIPVYFMVEVVSF